MDDVRKKVIIKEIQHWQKNRMLPEQYCNYLLALYTEGEKIEETAEKPAKRSSFIGRIFLYSLLIPIVAATLYYVDWPLLVQSVIVATVLAFLFSLAIASYRQEMLLQLIIAIGALVLLLYSFKVSFTYFHQDVVLGMMVIICNCLLWLFIGVRLKLRYFTFAGVAGLVVIIGALFFQ